VGAGQIDVFEDGVGPWWRGVGGSGWRSFSFSIPISTCYVPILWYRIPNGLLMMFLIRYFSPKRSITVRRFSSFDLGHSNAPPNESNALYPPNTNASKVPALVI